MDFETDWDAVDPERDFNEDTLMIYQALAERFGPEQARQSMAVIIELLGGVRYQIVSFGPIQERQRKEMATRLLEEGAGLIEVVRRSGLTLFQIKKLARQLGS